MTIRTGNRIGSFCFLYFINLMEGTTKIEIQKKGCIPKQKQNKTREGEKKLNLQVIRGKNSRVINLMPAFGKRDFQSININYVVPGADIEKF